jgi:hypothetical protein
MGFEGFKSGGHTKYRVVIADYDRQKRERASCEPDVE